MEKRARCVAPHAGAWIETSMGWGNRWRGGRSPLMQGRGLKLNSLLPIFLIIASPLMQGRGLKL